MSVARVPPPTKPGLEPVDLFLRRKEYHIGDDGVSKAKDPRNESKCFGDSPFFSETMADLVSAMDVERACYAVMAADTLHDESEKPQTKPERQIGPPQYCRILWSRTRSIGYCRASTTMLRRPLYRQGVRLDMQCCHQQRRK